ncbi:MAG TPA: hypothetical protein VGA13_08160 [Acidimicrobiales bacterium]|jgi:hypothetical protein
MTELLAPDTGIIAEALTVIDEALGRYSVRDVVPGDEVADLLLDLRAVLGANAAHAPEPAATSSS